MSKESANEPANQRFHPPWLTPTFAVGKKFINKITCRRADSASLESLDSSTLRLLESLTAWLPDSMTPWLPDSPPSQVENCSNFLTQRALPVSLPPGQLSPLPPLPHPHPSLALAKGLRAGLSTSKRQFKCCNPREVTSIALIVSVVAQNCHMTYTPCMTTANQPDVWYYPSPARNQLSESLN